MGGGQSKKKAGAATAPKKTVRQGVKENPLYDGGGDDESSPSADESISTIRAAVDDKIAQLNAIATVRGNRETEHAALVAGLAAKEASLATSQWQNMTKGEIAKAQAAVDDSRAGIDQLRAEHVAKQSEFGTAGAILAKTSERNYDAAFAAACDVPGGRDAAVELSEVLCASIAANAAKIPSSKRNQDLGKGGGKASMQPDDGKSSDELVQTGLAETARFFKDVMKPMAKKLPFSIIQNLCTVAKDLSRAYEKAYSRRNGSLLTVTDFGRGTATVAMLAQLLEMLKALVAELESKGYEITGIKASMDPRVGASERYGFRNILLNIRCPGSLHIIELQLNLTSLEEIKNGPLGHAVYELLRKSGYGKLVEYGGNWNADLGTAITSGRALTLNFEDCDWPDAAQVKELAAALETPACRVNRINAASATGSARMDLFNICFGTATVKTVKFVEVVCFPFLLWFFFFFFVQKSSNCGGVFVCVSVFLCVCALLSCRVVPCL